MGQKINPTGFRLAVTKDWSSKWFAKSNEFSTVLKQDIDVRDYLRKRLANASVGRVVIERPAKSARITIHSARPGVVIGKKRRRHRSVETRSASLDGCACACQHRRNPQA